MLTNFLTAMTDSSSFMLSVATIAFVVALGAVSLHKKSAYKKMNPALLQEINEKVEERTREGKFENSFATMQKQDDVRSGIAKKLYYFTSEIKKEVEKRAKEGRFDKSFATMQEQDDVRSGIATELFTSDQKKTLWQLFCKMISSAVNTVVIACKAIVKAISSTGKKIADFLSAGFRKTVDATSAAYSATANGASSAYTATRNAAGATYSATAKGASSAYQSVANIASSVYKKTANAAYAAYSATAKGASSAYRATRNAAAATYSATAKGASSAYQSVANIASSVYKKTANAAYATYSATAKGASDAYSATAKGASAVANIASAMYKKTIDATINVASAVSRQIRRLFASVSKEQPEPKDQPESKEEIVSVPVISTSSGPESYFGAKIPECFFHPGFSVHKAKFEPVSVAANSCYFWNDLVSRFFAQNTMTDLVTSSPEVALPRAEITVEGYFPLANQALLGSSIPQVVLEDIFAPRPVFGPAPREYDLTRDAITTIPRSLTDRTILTREDSAEIQTPAVATTVDTDDATEYSHQYPNPRLKIVTVLSSIVNSFQDRSAGMYNSARGRLADTYNHANDTLSGMYNSCRNVVVQTFADAFSQVAGVWNNSGYSYNIGALPLGFSSTRSDQLSAGVQAVVPVASEDGQANCSSEVTFSSGVMNQ